MIERSSISIIPFAKPCNAEVAVPGSKSISNRALILSVMCDAEVELIGLLESEDVNLMKEALQNLGITINKEGNNYLVFGKNGLLPKNDCSINVGNAGTIARFLTCLLASQNQGKYNMDGTDAMRKRPMLELLDCLQDMGSKITYEKEKGKFPFTLFANGLNKNIIEIDASKSGQNLSGLLMQCPAISKMCTINFKNGTVSLPFVEMTLKMMHEFNDSKDAQYTLKKDSIKIENIIYKKNKFKYVIEADATAASYFLTLPLVVGGECHVLGLKKDMLQGDIAYCNILEMIGGTILHRDDGIISSSGTTLSGGCFDFNDISDTFLTLAAISPLLDSRPEIYGIEHTRKQETDRIAAMACELSKLGQVVIEKSDRLIIEPNLNKLQELASDDLSINTYNDHRISMSFSILASYDLLGNGKSWLKINNPYCCEKTFPSFFSRLDSARNQSYAKK